MSTLKHSSKDRKAITHSILVLNLAIYFLVAYFVYHSLNGERGIFAYRLLFKELNAKNQILSDLLIEKSSLENNINLIHKNRLDLDMLDELVRRKLGLAGPNEIMIILKEDK